MASNSKKVKKAKVDISKYPYTDCREQHVWRPYDGALDNKRMVAYRVQKCANCDTKRHSILSLRAADYGQLVKASSYRYPDDYQVPGGLDRFDRGQIRMHNFLAEIANAKPAAG